MAGKQIPYLVLAMFNFGLMCLLAVTAFRVPITGSFLALLAAAVVFNICSTGIGLLSSTVTRSQVAAIFLTFISTLIPAVDFSGLIYPVSAQQGAARLIGQAYPATYMFAICRAVFAKGLGFAGVHEQIWPMIVAAIVIVTAAIALLKKQEN